MTGTSGVVVEQYWAEGHVGVLLSSKTVVRGEAWRIPMGTLRLSWVGPAPLPGDAVRVFAVGPSRFCMKGL